MPRTRFRPTTRPHAAPPAPPDERDDAELLDRFCRHGEQPAFETLLRRHGPLVWGACRRVLGRSADVDDAFQATFLVLVRKASSLRDPKRVGPWLYGVAVRVAARVKERSARFASHEAADMLPAASPPAEPDWLPELDRELAALPAKYREPLILCELQGLSRKAAAERLRLREGTLSSRLSRGRAMLRKRLLRHGGLLPAGGLLTLLGEATGKAVPMLLAARTVDAATGTVPAGVAVLTEEVLKAMMLTKLKLACGAMTIGLALALGVFAASPDAPKPTAEKAAPQVRVAKQGTDVEKMQGLWKFENYESNDVKGDVDIRPLLEGYRHLVRGTVMWSLPRNAEHARITAEVFQVNDTKKPKWYDTYLWTPGLARTAVARDVGIYQIDDDTMTMIGCRGGRRPVEFSKEPKEYIHRITLRPAEQQHVNLPPDKALLGSWVVPTVPVKPGDARKYKGARLQVYEDYMFLFLVHNNGPSEGDWYGGRYTIDATKSPRWVDIKLAIQLGEAYTLHGSYEVSGDRLQFAFSADGDRSFRPVEFAKPSNADWYAGFDFVRAKTTAEQEVAEALKATTTVK